MKTLTQPLEFLALLYGDETGFMELVYCVGDPLKKRFHTRGFYPNGPGLRLRVAEEAMRLADEFGDVYVSSSLYREERRASALALPTSVLFIDDAPPGFDYSFTVQTSEQSQHGYLRLTARVTPEERRDLQRRIAAGLGADKASANITQIVRVPGSFNTKRRGCFPVHLGAVTERVYAPEELRTMFPAVEAPDIDIDIDWERAHWWLDNISELLDNRELPKRIRPIAQTYKLLSGEYIHGEKTGEPDTSEAMAILANGLIMHRYPNEEIAALMWHFYLILRERYGKPMNKSDKWLMRDIEKLIGRYRAVHKDVVPEPTIIRPAHRPPKLTPEQLLAYYAERRGPENKVFISHKDAARELGISSSTIKRVEKKLRLKNQIQRESDSKNHLSWIELPDESGSERIK